MEVDYVYFQSMLVYLVNKHHRWIFQFINLLVYAKLLFNWNIIQFKTLSES